ncbi:MAG: Hpt domain-containing protein [Pseudomonadota bacterium]
MLSPDNRKVLEMATAALPVQNRTDILGDVDHRPIDLVHLAKQTLGNRSLENEVLRLFLTQSDIYLDRVHNACSREDRFAAVHTIKGSARNIGAWDVADAAETLEKAAADNCGGEVKGLETALVETRMFIRSILDEPQ